jgi:tricorn protease
VKRSDEEKGGAASAATKDQSKEADGAAAKDAKSAKVEPVRIDLDGIQNRILDLPVPVADLIGLEPGPAGQVFFLRRADEKSALQRFDLESRETSTLLPDVASYQISADARKLVYRVKDDWAIASATDKKIEAKDKDGKDGKLKMDAIEVRVDPRAEWPEMFEEAWRINRDYFYDPKMHGVDWKAMHEKYAAFLPHLTTRQDLNRVIRAMLSELSVGHSYITNPGDVAQPKAVPGGLLGADYTVENGRYKFAKVYGGLNWNPELRAPLTEPGVNVTAGEYLIAVGGRDVRPPANLYGFFENTAGKITDITVAPNADGRGARTVSVVPVESEAALRNRDWVEGNLRKVDAATGGRVAYVYVPNTAALGHAYFTRYFFPQSHKDAVILDERFNGGGSVADYYIDVLQRKQIAWWAMRYGPAMKTPSASIQGPKVMIADETAGSGGDLLPWMFKKFELGPVVGTRTWGGLIGILGYPELMDGGVITAPNLAFYDPEGGWTVEGQGVAPDIEVEMTPADVIAGRDPQLERAIQIVMDELKKSPKAAMKLPAYPNRSGTGAAFGSAGR